jgi:hypothetical protein
MNNNEKEINGEHFNYTEWHGDLFKGMTVEEISRNAMELRKRRRTADRDNSNQTAI